MTREELSEKMKDIPNPPTRVNLIQQVWEIMNEENKQLTEQIEKMKCDVLSIVKDRMNDDIDQNIIERLVEKWEIEK